jgi:hypothetical protein
MRLQEIFARKAMMVVVACLLPIGSALACPSLSLGSTVLNGQGDWDDDFQVAGTGTLTVSIGDVPTPLPLSDYELTVQSAPLAGFTSDSVTTIGELRGAGSLEIPVTPGIIYFFSLIQVSGTPAEGESSLDLTYQSGVTPVPVPGSLALLLPGLGLVFVRRSRRGGDAA